MSLQGNVFKKNKWKRLTRWGVAQPYSEAPSIFLVVNFDKLNIIFVRDVINTFQFGNRRITCSEDDLVDIIEWKRQGFPYLHVFVNQAAATKSFSSMSFSSCLSLTSSMVAWARSVATQTIITIIILRAMVVIISRYSHSCHNIPALAACNILTRPGLHKILSSVTEKSNRSAESALDLILDLYLQLNSHQHSSI